MIEFKADCGHTVRARDDDAGGAVRCSYCGKTVAVPDAGDGNLDFLFREIPAQQAEQPRRKWKLFSRKPRKAVQPGRRDEVNPFAIVLRLCYFALLLIIVIVVGDKFVIPMFNSEERARRMAGGLPGEANTTSSSPTSQPAGTGSGRGLLGDVRKRGLFVSSIPPRATAFVIDEAKAPRGGRIHRLSGVHSLRTDDCFSLNDGTYFVEVALPWNDSGLNDPSLPDYSDYLAFRRSLERASDSQRKSLQEEYFLPDEASTTFVSEDDDLLYFVRQYRGVSVQNGRSKGVRAFFLPKMGGSEQKRFAVEPLLSGYIPTGRRYGFDEKQVRAELNYFEVPLQDQNAVMEALSRAGAIPYAEKGGNVRMFKIDIHDGILATRVIREGGS